MFKSRCLSYSLAILLSGVYPKNNSVLVKRKHVQGYYTTSYIGEKKKEEHWCQLDSSSEIFSMEYDGKPCSREKEWPTTPWISMLELKENNIVRGGKKETHYRIYQDDFIHIMLLRDTHICS